jgi:hypothetical protein
MRNIINTYVKRRIIMNADRYVQIKNNILLDVREKSRYMIVIKASGEFMLCKIINNEFCYCCYRESSLRECTQATYFMKR